MLTNGLTGTAEATATTATDSQVLRHMGQTTLGQATAERDLVA